MFFLFLNFPIFEKTSEKHGFGSIANIFPLDQTFRIQRSILAQLRERVVNSIVKSRRREANSPQETDQAEDAANNYLSPSSSVGQNNKKDPKIEEINFIRLCEFENPVELFAPFF